MSFSEVTQASREVNAELTAELALGGAEAGLLGKADITSKVSDPSFVNFVYGRSSFLVATNQLPILIKEDPAP